jgi:hypothetical protein
MPGAHLRLAAVEGDEDVRRDEHDLERDEQVEQVAGQERHRDAGGQHEVAGVGKTARVERRPGGGVALVGGGARVAGDRAGVGESAGAGERKARDGRG